MTNFSKRLQATLEKFEKGENMIKIKESDYLPRECTFSPSDWKVLSGFWFPIALSKDIGEKPHPVTLLDERLIVYRVSAGYVVAKDLCVHRGSPLSYGSVEGDEIVCGIPWLPLRT